ncbi:MAG: replication initiator protein A [Candidatus Sedimenticola sp. (ex Thyasira tokunagai)]
MSTRKPLVVPNPADQIASMRINRLRKTHQLDLFVAGIVDASVKSDMTSMLMPFFSVAKRPNTQVKEFIVGNKTLKIEPGQKGQPTIWDKDILIYCASQITAALNNNVSVGRTVMADSYALLTATDRGTGGNSYDLLVQAISRIKGTQYSIEEDNPEPGVKRRWRALPAFIEDAIVTEYDDKKRAVSIDIVLGEAFYDALLLHDVLTFSSDYFLIRGGTERRLYELGRRFCGDKLSFSISLKKLQSRTGNEGTLRKFRENIVKLAKGQESELPEFIVQYDPKAQKQEGGKVTFIKRTAEEEEVKRARNDQRETNRLELLRSKRKARISG